MRATLRLVALSLLPILLASGAAQAAPKPKGTHVKLTWKTDEFPAELVVHEPKEGSTLPLWTTGSAKKAKDLPIGKEIDADKGFTMPAGQSKRLVLTLKNAGKKDLYFFATPHTVDPAKHTLGFDFRCLCLNHAYHAPAGETWYRVIELRLDAAYAGKDVEVVHQLVQVPKERAEQIQTKGAEIPPPKA
jgi:hypothetical protein